MTDVEMADAEQLNAQWRGTVQRRKGGYETVAPATVAPPAYAPPSAAPATALATQMSQTLPQPSAGTQINCNSQVGVRNNKGKLKISFLGPPPRAQENASAQRANMQEGVDDSGQVNIDSQVAARDNDEGGEIEVQYGAPPQGDVPSKSKFVRMVKNPICRAAFFLLLSLICLVLMIYYRVKQGVNNTSFEISTAGFLSFTLAADGFIIDAIVKARRKKVGEEEP